MEREPTAWVRKRPPVNLSLGKETIRLLEAIAEREGVKPSRVVDRLVLEEARRLELVPREEVT